MKCQHCHGSGEVKHPYQEAIKNAFRPFTSVFARNYGRIRSALYWKAAKTAAPWLIIGGIIVWLKVRE